MTTSCSPLPVPDDNGLKRKLSAPPPLLGRLYERYLDRHGRDTDGILLAELEAAPVADWARTGAAMQTLVERGNRESLP